MTAPRRFVGLQEASAYFAGLRIKEVSTRDRITRVNKAGWNVNGSRFGTAHWNMVRIWNAEKVEAKFSYVLGGRSPFYGEIFDIQWSPSDSETIAVLGPDRRIRWFDIRNNKEIWQVAEETNLKWGSYAWSGAYFVAAGDDRIVRVYDMQKRQKMMEYQSTKPSRCGIFSNDGSHLVLGSGSDVEILAFPDLTAFQTIKRSSGDCLQLGFDPHGKYLAVAAEDSYVTLFDTTDWCCTKTLGGRDFGICSMSLSHDGCFTAVTRDDSRVDVYHVESGESVYHNAVKRGNLATVAFHPSRQTLLYGLDEGVKVQGIFGS
jgi:WD40 repeat protein